MAGALGPRGLTYFGFAIGENGWGGNTNTSLQNLDALCQLSVLSTSTTAPPSLSGADAGKAYIIPSGATGAWSGLTNQIALWDGAAWDYYDPTGNTWTNWTVYDYATGNIMVFNGTAWVPIHGRFLGRTWKTSGTTFTTGAATRYVMVTAVGGGGGGGGVDAVAVSTGAGGGGGAGGVCIKWYTVSPSTGYTCAIGAGGGGGVGATPADGSAGGNTTFTDGSTLITAKGGLGGKSMTAVATSADAALLCMLGGAGQLSTNGDFNGTGESGDTGIVVPWTGSITFGIGAKGGNTPFGSGGNSVVPANTNSTAGVDATGYGAGGGGAAASYGGSDVDGGDGAPGVLIVDEYS